MKQCCLVVVHSQVTPLQVVLIFILCIIYFALAEFFTNNHYGGMWIEMKMPSKLKAVTVATVRSQPGAPVWG